MEWTADYYFNNYVQLRDRIIQLAEISNFLDVSIMPKKFIGIETFEVPLKNESCQERKEKEDRVIRVIKEFLPSQKVNKVPEQYFGEIKNV